MLDVNDFSKKQIVVYCPAKGDKVSYKNDNMIISNAEGKVKYQITCYRIFMLMIIGDCTMTTGIIRRAKKFGFAICFMTYSFRYYGKLNAGLEGNSYLHEKQYRYEGTEIARVLIYNKILNQRNILQSIRNKTIFVKDGILVLDGYVKALQDSRNMEISTIMGMEGNAAKVYFQRLFYEFQWKGRRPRIKMDYLNSLLDIGYTVLFNFIDALLQVYDFDTYKGVLHMCFYQRKSLTCDLMEPFRPIIDRRVRKGIHLGQFKKEDFILINEQYQLEYKKTTEYVSVFMEDVLKSKQEIFVYIRSYYRAFMKGKAVEEFPIYNIAEGEVMKGLT